MCGVQHAYSSIGIVVSTVMGMRLFVFQLISWLVLGAFSKLPKSTVLHVCLSAWSNSAVTGRIFVKFDISVFVENLFRKYKFN